jgi:hypothetical protein
MLIPEQSFLDFIEVKNRQQAGSAERNPYTFVKQAGFTAWPDLSLWKLFS